MPNHVRRQIREAVFGLLDNLETTGKRVYKNRVYPIQDMPAIIIYNGSEEIEPDNMNMDLMRIFDIRIEGYAKDDDTLDQISEEVEVALGQDQTLGGIAKNVYPVSAEFNYSDGEEPSGAIIMTYRVHYRTAIQTPNTAI